MTDRVLTLARRITRLDAVVSFDPDGYENAEQLARVLRVNGRSLRAILRASKLVPGHEEPDGSHYRIVREVAEQIARDPHVLALPRH